MTTTLTTSIHTSPPIHQSPSLAREMAPPISPGRLPPQSRGACALRDRSPFSDFDFAPPPFPIAGFRYYDGEEAFPELQPGTALTLRAEPDNPHDPCAVEILHRGRKLGYVPRFCNRRVSQLLLDDVPVSCEVARISADAPPWDAVAVRISQAQTELLAA